MPLNHSTANVIVSLDGLFLSCFNAAQEFEVALAKHHDHALSMDIIQVTPAGMRVLSHGLDLSKDLRIQLDDPVKPHASAFNQLSPFTRADGDDPEDFRWIVDLNDPNLHANRLSLKRVPRQRIFITDGIFYTMNKTQNRFLRIDYRRPLPPLPDFTFGKLADVTGADIQFTEPSSRLTFSAGATTFDIRNDAPPGARYFVVLKNTRNPNSTLPPLGGDFLAYYDHIEDRDGHLFDLEEITGMVADPASVDFFSKPPQNCDGTHLSGVTSLG